MRICSPSVPVEEKVLTPLIMGGTVVMTTLTVIGALFSASSVQLCLHQRIHDEKNAAIVNSLFACINTAYLIALVYLKYKIRNIQEYLPLRPAMENRASPLCTPQNRLSVLALLASILVVTNIIFAVLPTKICHPPGSNFSGVIFH